MGVTLSGGGGGGAGAQTLRKVEKTAFDWTKRKLLGCGAFGTVRIKLKKYTCPLHVTNARTCLEDI
jgi:hypothetical protein